jgi:arylsulfatase A-like enzyme
MKIILTLLVLTALLCGQAHAADNTPNILIIVSDDHGYADVGVQGAKDIPTPHLDSLAASGVRCTSGYVSSCMCSPSRAGLLTGRSQSRFGHEINWEPAQPIDPNDERGLPLTEKTIADQLKAAGYRTGIVGKWHLGESAPFHPNKRGFDEFFGFVWGGHDYFCDSYTTEPNPKRPKYAHYVTPLERNGVPEERTGYLTTVLGTEAAAFIHRHKAQPWMLYASFNAPHTPLQATPELLERVKHIVDEQRRTYAAMVCGLDDAVGAIVKQLREDGLEERTLIFFLSDNGGPLTRNGSLNTPLRGEKGGMLEGGIRIPFLVQWKGTLPAGKTYDRPVSSLDILPTALALAGSKSIAAQPLDGVNLIPHLKGESTSDPHEFLLWRMSARNIWAVRSGDHKLVMMRTKAPRLYDLSRDIAEETDLAAKLPEVRDRLQAAYDKWAATLPEPLWDVNDEIPPQKPANSKGAAK